MAANFSKKIFFWVMFILILAGYFFGGLKISLAEDSPQEPRYAGVDQCKVCHPRQYEEFMKRKFNKAWKVLEMRKEEKNPECLKCHVTGYDKPGGFVSAEKTPYLLNKQCESCHGPGSRHIKEPTNPVYREDINLLKKSNVCIECHRCMKTHREGIF